VLLRRADARELPAQARALAAALADPEAGDARVRLVYAL
jgi:hypothetical protein